MADTHSEWRTERRGDPGGRSNSWLDDRGVSEVIGSILVFGLLVALLAIVQTQAVPNSNQEVEAAHSADVQGDLANLKGAISRSSALGGTESVTVETGMSYPPRLVLYNPPAVQGTLSTGPSTEVSLQNFSAPETDTADYIAEDPTFETHTLSYRVNYNRYEDAPTTRFEHGALVDDYGDGVTVSASGELVSGSQISLTLLDGGLQASQVRPASITTYPRSAPARKVTVSPESGADPTLTIRTDLDDEVWMSELLADQIDTNALPDGQPVGCVDDEPDDVDIQDARGSGNTSDGRYIVYCEFSHNENVSNTLRLHFQRNGNPTYTLQTGKVGFSASSEPVTPVYVTDVSDVTPNGLAVEVRDQFNNPVQRQVALELQRYDASGNPAGTETIVTGPDGRAKLPNDLAREANVYLKEGPNNVTTGASCSALGCATVEPTGLPASSLIRVTNVSGDQNADTITFEFTNSGERETNISEVQLGYATQRNERTLTVTVGTLADCDLLNDPEGCTLDQTDVTTSFVTDGPSEIIQLEDGSGTVFEPTTSSGVGAEENRAPVEYDTNGADVGGDRPELAAGSSSEVTFSLDESITFDGEDSVDLSVTIYYEDGSVATYSRTLFNEQGDRGQS